MNKFILLVLALFIVSVSYSQNNCQPPPNLAVANVTSSSADLSWDTVPNAYLYQVKYKKASHPYWYTSYAYTNQKTLNYLADTMKYHYKVRTYCGQGNYSAWSAVDSFITLSNASSSCGVPTNFVVSNVGTNTATLSWDTVPGATGYYIHYRKQGVSYWSTTYSSNPTKTFYYLQDTTVYEYEVRAKCGYFNYSNYSPIGTFTTLSNSNSSCTPPTNVVASNVTHNSADISWTGVTGAMGYYIKYRKAGQTYWSTKYASGSQVSKTLNYLSDTTKYYFYMMTYCGYGQYSQQTAVDSFITLSNASSPCLPPTNVVASNVTHNSADISWNGVTGANGYYIKYKKATASYWSTKWVSSSATTKTLTYLSDTTKYYFYMMTYCGYGQYSVQSPVDSFITLSNAASPCLPPTNVVASNVTSNSADISWNGVTGASGYYIKYKKATSSYWSTRWAGGSATSKTLNYLSDTTKYYFYMMTYCGYGQYSIQTPVDSFITLSNGGSNACAAPTNVYANNITHNSAEINWTSGGSVYGYYIKYRKLGQSYWSTRWAGSAATSKVLNYLSDSTSYEYYMYSYCGWGQWSAYTTVDTFTTLGNSSPSICPMPTNIAVSNITAHSAEISWDTVPGASGYFIKYKKVSSNYWKSAYTYTNNKVIFYLADSSEYEFKVRSYCGYGNYGMWSAVDTFMTLSGTTTTPCAVPTNIVVSNVAEHSATISWTSNGSVGYQLRYKKAGYPYWFYSYVYTNTKNLKWLSDSSWYYFELRSYCGYGNYGAWSAVDSFMTLDDTTNILPIMPNKYVPYFSTSIDELDADINVTVYPNPSQGQFSVETDAVFDMIQVMDIQGRVLKEYYRSDRNSYDVSDLSRGTYFIRFVNDNTYLSTVRLVKR